MRTPLHRAGVGGPHFLHLSSLGLCQLCLVKPSILSYANPGLWGLAPSGELPCSALHPPSLPAKLSRLLWSKEQDGFPMWGWHPDSDRTVCFSVAPRHHKEAGQIKALWPCCPSLPATHRAHSTWAARERRGFLLAFSVQRSNTFELWRGLCLASSIKSTEDCHGGGGEWRAWGEVLAEISWC